MRAMKLTAALFAVSLAAPALLAQNQTVRIHAATVLDGTGKTLKNATIVVQGSKITSIETGGAAGADYELGQLTLVPGLIDVHAHVGWHFDKDGRYAARPGTPAQEMLYSAENAFVRHRTICGHLIRLRKVNHLRSTLTSQFTINCSISSLVTIQFLQPEVRIAFWNYTVTRTSMPETAIDKDSKPQLRKDEIWSA